MTRWSRRPRLWSWAIAAALTAATPAAAVAQPFSSLTFFGDSYTDSGNGDILATLLGAPDPTPSPPYAPGYISNGPTWAAYFAAALGRPGDAAPALLPFGARNYAIGTARTGLTGGFGAVPLGMLSQLGVHNGACAFGPVCPPGRAGDPTGLYTLFGGGNDVFDAAALASAADREAALQAAVNNLATIATALYAGGARSFLVPNVSDVGQFPAGLANPAGPARLGALSARFNDLLAARLALLDATLPGSTFYGLSLDALFDNIRRDARTGGARYGITNTTVPCFPPPFGAGLPSCEGSAFVDPLHATTAVHELIAEAAYRRVVFGVDVVAIPEPATVVLLAGGLVLIAAWGRARSARG